MSAPATANGSARNMAMIAITIPAMALDGIMSTGSPLRSGAERRATILTAKQVPVASAIRSPVSWMLPSESETMVSTPPKARNMANQVRRRRCSPRKTRPSSAAIRGAIASSTTVLATVVRFKARMYPL